MSSARSYACANRIFAGDVAAPTAFVELKLPAVVLATPEAKRRFVEEATDIVTRASRGQLARERWLNRPCRSRNASLQNRADG